jgi:hypothetical protein
MNAPTVTRANTQSAAHKIAPTSYEVPSTVELLKNAQLSDRRWSITVSSLAGHPREGGSHVGGRSCADPRGNRRNGSKLSHPETLGMILLYGTMHFQSVEAGRFRHRPAVQATVVSMALLRSTKEKDPSIMQQQIWKRLIVVRRD